MAQPAEQPVVMPTVRPWTLDDLEHVPDDGWRYEIVDGSLHVSPPPVPRHQVSATLLFRILDAAAPPDLLVLVGGAGIHVVLPDRDTEFLIPDVLVVRRAAVGSAERAFRPADVVLAVEVISRSSVTTDRVTKRELYAVLGVPHYWIVDGRGTAEVQLLRLHGEAYGEGIVAIGDDLVELDQPFPVAFRPADLLL